MRLLHALHMICIPPWWLPLIGISYNFFIVDILELISLRLASLDVTIRDTQKLGCCKKEKGTSQDTFVARLHIIQFLRAELQSSHCGRRKRRALRLYCVRASEGEWRIKQEYISSYMENIPNKNQDLVRLKNEGGRRNLHNGWDVSKIKLLSTCDGLPFRERMQILWTSRCDPSNEMGINPSGVQDGDSLLLPMIYSHTNVYKHTHTHIHAPLHPLRPRPRARMPALPHTRPVTYTILFRNVFWISFISKNSIKFRGLQVKANIASRN